MKVNHCKNCQFNGKLERIKDYEYQFSDSDPVEILDVLKCPICGCIHWEEGGGVSWEFIVGNKEEKSAVSSWVTDQQAAKQKHIKREVSYG